VHHHNSPVFSANRSEVCVALCLFIYLFSDRKRTVRVKKHLTEPPRCYIGTFYISDINGQSDTHTNTHHTHTHTHLPPPTAFALPLLFSVFMPLSLREWGKQAHQYSVFSLSTHPLPQDYQTGLQHRFHNKSYQPF